MWLSCRTWVLNHAALVYALQCSACCCCHCCLLDCLVLCFSVSVVVFWVLLSLQWLYVLVSCLALCVILKCFRIKLLLPRPCSCMLLCCCCLLCCVDAVGAVLLCCLCLLWGLVVSAFVECACMRGSLTPPACDVTVELLDMWALHWKLCTVQWSVSVSGTVDAGCVLKLCTLAFHSRYCFLRTALKALRCCPLWSLASMERRALTF